MARARRRSPRRPIRGPAMVPRPDCWKAPTSGAEARRRRPPRPPGRSRPARSGSWGRRSGSELRTLDVVTEHFAHGAPDLALGGVVARAVQDLLHQIRLARRLAGGGGQGLEGRRARALVPGALDLGDAAPLLLL